MVKFLSELLNCWTWCFWLSLSFFLSNSREPLPLGARSLDVVSSRVLVLRPCILWAGLDSMPWWGMFLIANSSRNGLHFEMLHFISIDFAAFTACSTLPLAFDFFGNSLHGWKPTSWQSWTTPGCCTLFQFQWILRENRLQVYEEGLLKLWPQLYHRRLQVEGDAAGVTTRGVRPHAPVKHTIFFLCHSFIKCIYINKILMKTRL